MPELTIEYEKDVLTNGYYMKTEVISAVPSSIEKCLVLRKPNTSDSESLVRVATLVDLEALPLAGALVHFTAPNIGNRGAGDGDTLRISVLPPEWVKAELVAPLDFEIDSIVDVNTVKILVGVPFPLYYRGDDITWELRIGSGPVGELIHAQVGGETLREQDPDDLYYLTSEYVDVYPDLGAAVNAQQSLDAQAQSLVDASNLDEDSFSGTDTEVYE